MKMTEARQTRIKLIAIQIANTVIKKNEEYADSWKKYGGFSAFMNLARKWDRIEHQTSQNGYDLFATLDTNKGVDDDLLDLIGYALLVLAETPSGEEPAGRGYVDQD